MNTTSFASEERILGIYLGLGVVRGKHPCLPPPEHRAAVWGASEDKGVALPPPPPPPVPALGDPAKAVPQEPAGPPTSPGARV